MWNCARKLLISHVKWTVPLDGTSTAAHLQGSLAAPPQCRGMSMGRFSLLLNLYLQPPWLSPPVAPPPPLAPPPAFWAAVSLTRLFHEDLPIVATLPDNLLWSHLLKIAEITGYYTTWLSIGIDDLSTFLKSRHLTTIDFIHDTCV